MSLGCIVELQCLTNLFSLSSASKEKLLFTLVGSFEDIIGVSQINGDATCIALKELFQTVLDKDKSCSVSAVIQQDGFRRWMMFNF